MMKDVCEDVCYNSDEYVSLVGGDDGGNCSSHDADEDGVVDGGGCENGGEGGKVE